MSCRSVSCKANAPDLRSLPGQVQIPRHRAAMVEAHSLPGAGVAVGSALLAKGCQRCTLRSKVRAAKW